MLNKIRFIRVYTIYCIIFENFFVKTKNKSSNQTNKKTNNYI